MARAPRSRAVTSPRSGRRTGSPTSSPRTSSTSRRPARTSRSSTVRRGTSTGRRTPSTTRRSRVSIATRSCCSGSSRICAGRPSPSMVVDLARELGVEMMITLGSLLADVPHTRPSPVTGGATDQELIERLGLAALALRRADRHRGRAPRRVQPASIPSVSLWAAVPHYVSLAPSPRAALALCQRLGDVLGTQIDTAELEEASERYSEQVSEAVAVRRGDLGVRRGARAARRAAGRRGGPSLRRVTRGRAHALPSRARARQRRTERGPSEQPSALAERKGVSRQARREAELEQAVRRARFCVTSV